MDIYTIVSENNEYKLIPDINPYYLCIFIIIVVCFIKYKKKQKYTTLPKYSMV